MPLLPRFPSRGLSPRQDVRDRLRYLQLHLLDAVWQAFATLTGLPAQGELPIE